MTPSQEHHLGPHDAVRVWDVQMPPIKADMVSGALVPTVGRVLVPALRQKTSRVTIEIHTDTGGGGGEKGGDDTEVVMEGLLRGKSMRHAKNEVLHDGEFAIMRIFRRKKKGGGLFGVFGGKEDEEGDEGTRICRMSILCCRSSREPSTHVHLAKLLYFSDVDDERSVSSFSLSGVDKEFADGMWTEDYFYSSDDVELLKHHRRTVGLKLGRGNDTKVRDLNFANEHEGMFSESAGASLRDRVANVALSLCYRPATTFCSILESLGKLEEGRGQRRVEAFKAGPHGDKIKDIGSKIQILVEIVSAVRLPVADLKSTDAYVTVHLGNRQLHKTDYLSNT